MKIILVFVGVIAWITVMACCKVSGDCSRAEEAQRMASADNRCVCCGQIIPEGTWVCPNCQVCVEDEADGKA